ncbi:MAG: type II toxin-antitoxin system HipA family toxin [Gammaproteobacteria bacterium]|nr:type II toxin-antitoxin system HipA family toxin [Gammaproteobacteria bacterium]
MTSKGYQRPEETYVWIWLPQHVEPVVAGRLAIAAQGMQFNYGQSYLAREDAIPIYQPELPLRPGNLPLLPGLSMPGCLRDASPDAWGRRVIINRVLGGMASNVDTDALDELSYLLESGSDRIGALDFQCSPTEYQPRLASEASLEELLSAAECVEQGLPLSAALDQVLIHGTSIGGARPKAMLQDGKHKYIAKFSSSTDLYNVIKAEYLAMRLAAKLGLQVAPVKLASAAGKDILLVERFDRRHTPQGWQRKAMVSALTLLGLDEMMARYASYEQLAEIIRHHFASPKANLRELFCRLVFNILCGNTDDHARNHAAYWDGHSLTLTPAFDLCPQPRTGNEATQAMLIRGANRFSRLSVCLDAAPQFLLSKDTAREIIEAQIAGIHHHWHDTCEEAQLTKVDRQLLWGRQFLNPYAQEAWPANE